MGPFDRLTRRRPEPPVAVDPRRQAHPMPAGPSEAPESGAPRKAAVRAPVPVMAEPEVSGGTPVPAPRADPDPPPSHRWTAEEQPYDRLDCPACGSIIRELPEMTAGCAACGATIRVLTCPEGVRHLLTASDAEVFDGDWDAAHAHRRREEALRRNASALRARRSTLASYVELGVRLVELRTSPGACAACLAAATRPYRPRAAPDLPIAGCEHEFCRCVYAPARPTASRH
jgi:hypothetical protein